MCYYPIYLKKEDIRVCCGRCPDCIEDKIRSWTVRCYHESTVSVKSYFLTITFKDEELLLKNGINTLDKRLAQLFLKRLRKSLGNYSFRYLLAGEYGDKTFRSHYHILLFLKKVISFERLYRDIKTHWGKGNIKLEEMKIGDIAYSVRYVYDIPFPLVELCENTGIEKPFILTSRRPALGLNFLSDKKKQLLNEDYKVLVNGFNYKLPRYYKNKIKETYEFLYKHKVSQIQEKMLDAYWEERNKFLTKAQYEEHLKQKAEAKEKLRLFRKSLLTK